MYSGYLVKVSPPWIISQLDMNNCPDGIFDQCAMIDANSATGFVIWTMDPDAPARNVTIYPYPSSETCP
jgi:hypothetical protein